MGDLTCEKCGLKNDSVAIRITGHYRETVGNLCSNCTHLINNLIIPEMNLHNIRLHRIITKFMKRIDISLAG